MRRSSIRWSLQVVGTGWPSRSGLSWKVLMASRHLTLCLWEVSSPLHSPGRAPDWLDPDCPNTARDHKDWHTRHPWKLAWTPQTMIDKFILTWNSSSVSSAFVSVTSGHRLSSFQGPKNFRKGVEVETVRMAEKRRWDHCYLWLRVSCPSTDVVGKGVCWAQLFDGKGAARPGTFPRLIHNTNQHKSSYTLLLRGGEAHCKHVTSKTKKIHRWNSGQQAGLVGGKLCGQSGFTECR